MKTKARLFLPYWFFGFGCHLGLSVLGRLRAIKEAGFGGVEILLTPNVAKNFSCFFIQADNLGLDVRWHQCWELRHDPSMWFSHPLDWARQLPRANTPLSAQIPKGVVEPVVIYANYWARALRYPNFQLQTIAAPTPQTRKEKYEFSYQDFLHILRTHEQLGVVFDTQHFLEYSLETYGVENIPTDRNVVLGQYADFWQEFGHRVDEIHLADTVPSWGHLQGRNVFPEEGVLPLRRFLHDIVGPQRWEIPITSEVNPKHLRGRSLADLRRKVEQLLD